MYLMNFHCFIRLEIKRLEAEKKELTFELGRLNELTNNGQTPVDVVCKNIFLYFILLCYFFDQISLSSKKD